MKIADYLGNCSLEKFPWFHPDEATYICEWDGKDAYIFDESDGVYLFVHQGGETYSFDNYKVYLTKPKEEELK